MELYYEGSDGSIINFMEGPISAQAPETLTESGWDYSTISGVNGLGRVKRFYKNTQEMSLKISIMTDSAEEFNQIMYDIHRTLDRDVRRLKPGKLWWNGFYKEVFAVETSQEEFEELFEAVERQLMFISVYPYWVRKHFYMFRTITAPSGGLDYDDFDFSFDYDSADTIKFVNNDCIDQANFELTFYGPCENPSVVIGNHTYEMLIDMTDGEKCVINSARREITKYDEYGQSENVFHLRSRDSYIFEKIPEGPQPVLRSNDVDVELTIYDERGEPEWI